MRFDVITIFPEMLRSVTGYGVTGRAVDKGLLRIHCWNPRDYAQGEYRAVDDRPYGGGPGMVMTARPLAGAIEAIRDEAGCNPLLICLSPQGELVDIARIQPTIERDGGPIDENTQLTYTNFVFFFRKLSIILKREHRESFLSG
ncbi:hypothetical protein ACFL1S_06730 [Pseudomonadota bacterium]